MAADAVGQYEVGEGAADVDADPTTHQGRPPPPFAGGGWGKGRWGAGAAPTHALPHGVECRSQSSRGGGWIGEKLGDRMSGTAGYPRHRRLEHFATYVLPHGFWQRVEPCIQFGHHCVGEHRLPSLPVRTEAECRTLWHSCGRARLWLRPYPLRRPR